MTDEELMTDLNVMISADAVHLVAALSAGDRKRAHELVDAIITNKRQLEDLCGALAATTTAHRMHAGLGLPCDRCGNGPCQIDSDAAPYKPHPLSLGEQPHDASTCHMAGQPHLGPCIDPRGDTGSQS